MTTSVNKKRELSEDLNSIPLVLFSDICLHDGVLPQQYD